MVSHAKLLVAKDNKLTNIVTRKFKDSFAVEVLSGRDVVDQCAWLTVNITSPETRRVETQD